MATVTISFESEKILIEILPKIFKANSPLTLPKGCRPALIIEALTELELLKQYEEKKHYKNVSDELKKHILTNRHNNHNSPMYFDKIVEEKGLPYVIGGLFLSIIVPSLLLTLTSLGGIFIFASIFSIFLSSILIGMRRAQQHYTQLNGSSLEQTIREIRYRSGRLSEQEHVLEKSFENIDQKQPTMPYSAAESALYPNLTQRGLFHSTTSPVKQANTSAELKRTSFTYK
jgi:hypothetical protein